LENCAQTFGLGREVAALESVGDSKSVLNYLPGTASEDFVSLTMPVRTESYVWDDQLPPIFQMNLPESYLLQVLQEQFGPQIGASPTALLSVIGRQHGGPSPNRGPGAVLQEPPIRLRWPSVVCSKLPHGFCVSLIGCFLVPIQCDRSILRYT